VACCTTEVVPRGFTEGRSREADYKQLLHVCSPCVVFDSEVLHRGAATGGVSLVATTLSLATTTLSRTTTTTLSLATTTLSRTTITIQPHHHHPQPHHHHHPAAPPPFLAPPSPPSSPTPTTIQTGAWGSTCTAQLCSATAWPVLHSNPNPAPTPTPTHNP
jgi:hypothetical protein